MTLVLTTLAGRGYRRIGLAIAEVDLLSFGMRSFGAYATWQRLLPERERIPVHVNKRIGKHGEDAKARAAGRKDYACWLKEYAPDVVVAGSGAIFYEWLLKLGRHVPQDIGFASLGVLPETQGLAGIDQNHRLNGAATTDLIVGQFHRNEYGLPHPEKTVLIEGSWVEGETVRGCPLTSPFLQERSSTQGPSFK